MAISKSVCKECKQTRHKPDCSLRMSFEINGKTYSPRPLYRDITEHENPRICFTKEELQDLISGKTDCLLGDVYCGWYSCYGQIPVMLITEEARNAPSPLAILAKLL